MKVSYDKDVLEKAKREGLHLLTFEINGKFAKKDGVTFQGYLFTEEEVHEAWTYLTKLFKREKKGKDGKSK